MWWVVAVVTAVALAATYLTWTAARVDRLHGRAAAAFGALDAHLTRRAEAAAAAAEEASLLELGVAARAALGARPDDREASENDLTRQLRGAVELGALPPPVVAELVAASRRVALARQVHEDVVRDALIVRRRATVRLFRLTRHHPRPTYFDVGDPALEPAAAVRVNPPTVQA